MGIERRRQMRNMTLGLMAALVMGGGALPAVAKDKTQWVYDGKAYDSYESCKRAKDKSKDRAAVVGAASAGTVAALAGGSLAETALVAGAGALTGAVIGKNAKKC
jgi:hypothetical protein